MPQAAPVQPAPEIVQLTAGFAVLPTVAVNVLAALIIQAMSLRAPDIVAGKFEPFDVHGEPF